MVDGVREKREFGREILKVVVWIWDWDGRAPGGTNGTESKTVEVTIEAVRYQIEKFWWELRPVCHGSGWCIIKRRGC